MQCVAQAVRAGSLDYREQIRIIAAPRAGTSPGLAAPDRETNSGHGLRAARCNQNYRQGTNAAGTSTCLYERMRKTGPADGANIDLRG